MCGGEGTAMCPVAYAVMRGRHGATAASRDKDVDVYRTELEVTSRINRYLSDTAFRNIALGANYFRLLALEYEAPRVCAD